jgi:hypothetical protein
LLISFRREQRWRGDFRFNPKKKSESAQLALGGANVWNRQCVLVAVVTCLATMSITPVLAAARQIEDFCFERLQHATLALRRGAGKRSWLTA